MHGHRQPPVPYTLAKTTWHARPSPVPPGPWKVVVGTRVVKTPAMDTAVGGWAWGGRQILGSSSLEKPGSRHQGLESEGRCPTRMVGTGCSRSIGRKRLWEGRAWGWGAENEEPGMRPPPCRSRRRRGEEATADRERSLAAGGTRP